MKKLTHVDLIGAASGWGARRRGCEFGPQALQKAGLDQAISRYVPTTWEEMIHPRLSSHPSQDISEKEVFDLVADHCDRLAGAVRKSLEQGHLPLVTGGDHACAIGTFSATAAALNACGELGLIWLDAHLDAHTFTTTPSGCIHGMPAAVLLGHGENVLTSVGGKEAKINPAHLVYIGARSWEHGEAALLAKLGVRIYSAEDVNEQGFASVFAEALDIATTGTKGFGLTFDLDIFDPLDAPGIGTPEKNGLRATDVLPVMQGIGRHPALRALELVEYNPERDKNNKTAELACRLASDWFMEKQE